MNSISKKLLTGVVLASSIITLFTTTFVMYQSYLVQLEMNTSKIEILFESSKSGLINSIWELNSDQIKSQINGFTKFPGIDQVKLDYLNENKTEYIFAGKIEDNHLVENFSIERNFQKLGNISFFSNKSRIIDILWSELLETLLIQFIKTMLSSLLILQVINGILTSNLNSLITQIKQNNLTDPIVLKRIFPFFKQNDELNILENSVNEFKHKISTQYQELETKIVERTKSLAEQTIKAKLSDKAKSKFIASISHEIRTPMNGILGFSSKLLENHSLDMATREGLFIIENCAESLLVIINDILSFSSLSNNSIKLAQKPFSPIDLLDSCIAILKPKSESKGIELKHSVNLLPKYLLGDKTRVSQIIFNIVGNAIKFTENGHVIINSSWKKGDLTIEVRDTGIGIAEDEFKNLFKDFSQIQGDSNKNSEGTGLGLSITKKLCHLMNGDISIKSEFGKGSVFTINLNLEQTSQMSEDLKNKILDINKISTSIYILVAEDNNINRELLKAYFNSLPIRFDFAFNGKEAIELANKNNYDLILMDIRMPIVNGDEAAYEIRKLDRYKNIPIIALTADVLSSQNNSYSKAGFNEVLSKPIRKNKLLSTFSKYCK